MIVEWQKLGNSVEVKQYCGHKTKKTAPPLFSTTSFGTEYVAKIVRIRMRANLIQPARVAALLTL